MRQIIVALTLILALFLSSGIALAQSAQEPSSSVPRVIAVTGVFQPVDGQPPRAVETITLALYAEATGGAPLWQEVQSVAVDAKGRYAVLLGATSADGIPAAALAAGAQWLGTKFERPSEVESARAQLTSVPYTLRAADADTLGGRPASAYLLAPTSSGGQTESAGTSAAGSSQMTASASGAQPSASTPQAVLPGTVNFLSKYVNAADVGDSAVFENLGKVGIGTTLPLDSLHVRFTNTNGAFTGYAVQNLGNTATSYSGTLFYDQNGVLGQFQGFNNVTHEYRINNVAKNGGGFYDGSINFMIGGTSKFFVSPVSVGIGTTSPSPTSNLDVSNAISGSGATNVNVTSYAANGSGANVIGRKARGTPAAPTAVLSSDGLLTLSGNGYGATGFAGVNSAVITMRAAENWTDTAQGSYMNFSTTPNGSTGPITRMEIGSNGRVGIGVNFAQAPLEVSNFNGASGAGMIYTTTYTSVAGTSLFIGRRARGTGLAPTAVLSGDPLAGFLAQGYGATAFGGRSGGMLVVAAENWTDTAQGASLVFNTTATGTITPGTKMTIDPAGNVGIGTQAPNGLMELSKTGTANLLASSYGGQGSGFKARAANGTFAAPTATLFGDELAEFTAAGYGTTGFNETAGWAAFAAEDWTDASQGTALGIFSTPIGSNEAQLYVGVLANGNVGIGTPQDGDGFPTATDKLQIFGDARVGDAGTNGCLKRFDGNFLVGTCVSDRRFKKNITPFGRVLDQLSALQPVNYYWRSAEYPERHFGDSQAYGLIAQDVEQILPELVVTNGDGYKAVDYTKLPLLTLEAVRELKAENDDLKRRLAEVERLLAEMLAGTSRRP